MPKYHIVRPIYGGGLGVSAGLHESVVESGALPRPSSDSEVAEVDESVEVYDFRPVESTPASPAIASSSPDAQKTNTAQITAAPEPVIAPIPEEGTH